MIYITGDTHADFTRFSNNAFPEQKEMTKDDYVIILGDFGGVWDHDGESAQEKWWLNWLEEKPYTTLFIDGNHENFNRLEALQVKEWHGGFVHEVRPSILHLMRGNVFEIEDALFFTFGGARSHDIDGGILDKTDPNFQVKKKELDRHMKCYRIKDYTWWEQEMPNEKEKATGMINLARHNFKVDFILSHDCPGSTLALFGHGMYKPDELNHYLDDVRAKTEFKKWFFGHYHDNRNINMQEIMMYEQIIRIR